MVLRWAIVLGMASVIKAATVMAPRGHYTVMQHPEGNEFCVEPGPAGDHA